jgi:3-dehydroquinate dehydratase/shikimate dehydrogenase
MSLESGTASVVASVRVRSSEQTRRDLAEAKRLGADAAELRLDEAGEPDLASVISSRPLPLIATCRPVWEGGRFAGTEEDRMLLLSEAARLGVEWIDQEFKAYKDIPRHGAGLILSYHDMERVPERLERMVARMALLNPWGIKIAARAAGMADVLTLLELQKANRGRRCTVIPMGDFGSPMRILFRKYGAGLTYTSLQEGSETAEGQRPLEELVRSYRISGIDPGTEVYAVVGNPVAHSRSPALFNAAFEVLDLPARYVPIRLDDASFFRSMLDAFELRGASVTVPHKEAVLPQLDRVDATARAIGAVNTVWKEAGGWSGTNTDAPAVAEAVRSGCPGLTGLKAIILGAGGSARAAAWALKQEGVGVTVCARRREAADRLARNLGVTAAEWGEAARLPAEILLNATPVGMSPQTEVSPVAPGAFQGRRLAVEMVYTPRRTRFLADAESAGCVTVDGTEIFLRQAALQHRVFTGRDLPPLPEPVRRILFPL